MPLVVAFLALRFDKAEQPTRSRFVGMLIGLGGVVALVGIDIGGQRLGAAGRGGGAHGHVRLRHGPLIVKRHLSGADPLGPVAGALGIASIMLLPLAIGGAPTETPTGEALASVAVLGLICTAFAFLIFFRLIAEIGPSRATIITYVNPVVALALGVAILDEQVTTGAVAGLLLILAGSWLSTDGRVPPGLVARGDARGTPPTPRESARGEPERAAGLTNGSGEGGTTRPTGARAGAGRVRHRCQGQSKPAGGERAGVGRVSLATRREPAHCP